MKNKTPFIIKLLDSLVMKYMQYNLTRLREKQDTLYIYINGTGKDSPKYLMYTDDKTIRSKMHAIY